MPDPATVQYGTTGDTTAEDDQTVTVTLRGKQDSPKLGTRQIGSKKYYPGVYQGRGKTHAAIASGQPLARYPTGD